MVPVSAVAGAVLVVENLKEMEMAVAIATQKASLTREGTLAGLKVS